MWSLLHSLTIAPAGPPLIDRARTLCGDLAGAAERVVSDEDADALAELTTGLTRWSVCWYLLRPALSERDWRRLRAELRRQRGWRAAAGRGPLTRRQQQRLRRHLRRERQTLERLAAPPSNAVLYDRVRRLHRKARRSTSRGKAARRSERLAAALELLGRDAALSRGGRLDDSVLAMSSRAFHRELLWCGFLEAARASAPRLNSPDRVA